METLPGTELHFPLYTFTNEKPLTSFINIWQQSRRIVNVLLLNGKEVVVVVEVVEAGVGVPGCLELEKVSMTQRLTELSVYVFLWLCNIHNQQSLAVVSLVYGGTNDVACCRVFEQYFNISGSLVRFKKYCKVPPDEASLVQLGGGGEKR